MHRATPGKQRPAAGARADPPPRLHARQQALWEKEEALCDGRGGSSSSPWHRPPGGAGLHGGGSQPLHPARGELPTLLLHPQCKTRSILPRNAPGPLGQCVLAPHILPDVGLVEHHDGHGVHLPALLGGLGSHPKALGGRKER